MKSPVITHVVPTIARFAGGPTVGVRRLNEVLTAIMPEAEHGVVSGDAEGGVGSLDDWQQVRPLLLPGRGPSRLGWTPDLHGALMRRAPTLIHIHGLWRHHTWAAARAAVSLGVPYVVSPHGMLEPWALRQSRRKKWLAGALFQERLLRNAACILATSRMEAESVRAAGYTTAPIAIVANGVDLPPSTIWRSAPTSRPPPAPCCSSRACIPRKDCLISWPRGRRCDRRAGASVWSDQTKAATPPW